jgi:aldose 1-epimerase
VVLRHALWPRPGYPFHLSLAMQYRLGEDGLTATLTATNVGAAAAPYGCAIHPYLVAGGGRIDDWTLRLPCDRYLDVDSDRLLPTAEQPVAGTAYDFRTPRPVGGTELDYAFTGVDFDAAGRAYASLLDHTGRGVRIGWERACRWVQVHTADRPEPSLHRTGLALEPMTCPPNAFRTGTDVVHLQPGESHTATWTISAVSCEHQ